MDSITTALESARVSLNGLSFAGKSLKLNNEEDAKEIIEKIEKCKELQYLNLEGNTLGVDASKGIAKALEKHPEFKRALWKDLFTGRMKEEIPKALEFLGSGLVTAGAKLTELDLSDNAFGPIGVRGLAFLLRSSSCYALEELRLNNNGLGITGGKLLAEALTDCYDCSKKQGKPLALKVFIAGRNRLENEGAKALAQVFKLIGTLEEVAMPQNGIYHVGISALFDAFTHNPNLEILNLNDNTITHKGAEAVAKALPALQNLKIINFGDCLLKTKGANHLAKALEKAHVNLEELILESNEIGKEGGLAVCDSIANKVKIKSLVLDGNQFGEQGLVEINKKLKEVGKFHVASINDNEDSDEEEEEEEGESDEEEEESDASTTEETIDLSVSIKSLSNKSTVEQFQINPSEANFMGLGDGRSDLLLNSVKKLENVELESFVPMLMRISALSTSARPEVAEAAFKCTEQFYKELFVWAQKYDNISIVNNSLLVNLGLIKCEDKKFIPSWNLESCLTALNRITLKNYVPDNTKQTLKTFMEREIENNGKFKNVKQQILSNLK
ncbi:unnamed protein product [Brassicogethes aeneus]|uniref:Ran-GTPase activating protein 1 C-terminal domain-containing protein n=1 Tax=Brassicogethes aeneus TaxID=1431903 RepID=A0A9P0AUT4_BRAAE|nr:unnamed protein product [Brassicogethes aeneus]